ncbi:MAG: N-6 DNA methylase, partial [Rickettsiaceae bacterium]|nr:N-6 DNA methylase [Rickettsiaceae bacterium]
ESRLAKEVARLVIYKIIDELSSDENINFYALDEELLNDVGRKKVYQRILNIGKVEKNLPLDDFDLGFYWVAEIVKSLQDYALLANSSYISPLADVYEIFNSGQFKGGRGQFFTPPVVVNLAFELLNPTRYDIICDPACGTGNFISKTILNLKLTRDIIESEEQYPRKDISENNIFGQDIESDLVNIAREYTTILGGRFFNNLSVGDSLNIADSILPLEHFTKVFTNPPFGTNIQITNSEILEQYDLGHQLVNGIPSSNLSKYQHPERLFIEVCVKLLKNNGEAAIILPRQTLSGNDSNTIEVRKWILKNLTVLAVIDLPPDTFQPYTGTIASLILLKKTIPTKNHKIFFGVCEHVGHDRRGAPLYKLDDNGNNVKNNKSNILMDDTIEVLSKWNEFLKTGDICHQNQYGFLIDLDTLNQRLTLNAWSYNPEANDAYLHIMSLVDKGYQIISLKDICSNIFVPTRHKRKYVENSDKSIPFLSTSQIFQIHDIDYKYQPLSFARSQNLIVEEGWILITRSGSTGRVRYVNSELSNCSISDHCIRVIPNNALVDAGYLYAFLSSPTGQKLIDQGRYASVIETISHTRIGEIPIPIPSIEIQKEIGNLIRESEEVRVRANKLRESAINKLDF